MLTAGFAFAPVSLGGFAGHYAMSNVNMHSHNLKANLGPFLEGVLGILGGSSHDLDTWFITMVNTLDIQSYLLRFGVLGMLLRVQIPSQEVFDV